MSMVRRVLASMMLVCLGASVSRAAAPELRAFLVELGDRPEASIADGVKVAALFAGVWKGETGEVGAREGLLKAGLLSGKDASDFRSRLSRGLACYLFFRTMRMKGGWIARLFGPNPRHAYKEFVALGLMAEEGVGSAMSGADLLGLLKLMTVYRKRGGL